MWWISAWIPRKCARNIEILYVMKWYVRIWNVCPNSNNWWPVYEWRRAAKRDFELCFCFFGGNIFLSWSKNYKHRTTFKLPYKRGGNFKSDTKLSQASNARFTKQRNQALQLFVYFPFCKIHATAYSLLFILFVDQGAFDLLQSYFLPILKIRCYFNALMIERKEVVFQVRRYDQFLSFASENLFSRKFRRFFSKLKFKENVFEATFVGIFVWVRTYIHSHVTGFIL